MRNSRPDSSGSCATFCATPTLNGLIGLNAMPTAAEPMLIATAVIGSYPALRTSSSSTGTSGMTSSHMPSTAPPAANVTQQIGTMRFVR